MKKLIISLVMLIPVLSYSNTAKYAGELMNSEQAAFYEELDEISVKDDFILSGVNTVKIRNFYKDKKAINKPGQKFGGKATCTTYRPEGMGEQFKTECLLKKGAFKKSSLKLLIDGSLLDDSGTGGAYKVRINCISSVVEQVVISECEITP